MTDTITVLLSLVVMIGLGLTEVIVFKHAQYRCFKRLEIAITKAIIAADKHK